MICVFCDTETTPGHGYDICDQCARKVASFAQKQKYLKAYLADLSDFAAYRHDDITIEQWKRIREKILKEMPARFIQSELGEVKNERDDSKSQ